MPAYISHSLKAVRFKKRCIIQCFLNNTFFDEKNSLAQEMTIVKAIYDDIFFTFFFSK